MVENGKIEKRGEKKEIREGINLLKKGQFFAFCRKKLKRKRKLNNGERQRERERDKKKDKKKKNKNKQKIKRIGKNGITEKKTKEIREKLKNYKNNFLFPLSKQFAEGFGSRLRLDSNAFVSQKKIEKEIKRERL